MLFAEHVGMTADHLVRAHFEGVAEGELSRKFKAAGHEQEHEEKIAHFVAGVPGLPERMASTEFMTFFY